MVLDASQRGLDPTLRQDDGSGGIERALTDTTRLCWKFEGCGPEIAQPGRPREPGLGESEVQRSLRKINSELVICSPTDYTGKVTLLC